MPKHILSNATILQSSFVVVVLLLANTSSFLHAFSVQRMKTQLHVTRDEYLRPHFETSVVESYEFDFERILECAKSVTGECPIEEMTQMMEELERWTTKSASSDTKLLALEEYGTQQVVYHALQSQVELARARSELDESGIVEKTVERQPTPPSHRDIEDLLRQMRDIADHEEI